MRLCLRVSLCLEERKACVCQVPANDALLSFSKPVRRYTTARKITMEAATDRQKEGEKEGREGDRVEIESCSITEFYHYIFLTVEKVRRRSSRLAH